MRGVDGDGDGEGWVGGLHDGDGGEEESGGQRRRARPAVHFNSTIATAIAGRRTSRTPAFRVTPANGTGFTPSGAANVLCVCIVGAVSSRPAAEVGVMPASVTATVAGWFGFVLTSERWTVLPSAERVADALTAGIFSPPNA